VIVLALNCGSSSLKFRLFQAEPGTSAELRRLAGGHVERLGDQATLSFEAEGGARLDAREPVRTRTPPSVA
jgi:acetate kinase